MLKNVAVENCVLVADTGEGNISIDTPASANMKIDNKGVYAGTVTISISGLSGSGFTNGSGSGTLTGSAQFNKLDNQPVILEGDQSVTIMVSATTTSTPPEEIEVPTVVTIQSAGQTVVQAE